MTPLEVNKKIAKMKGYHVQETINGLLFEKVYYENGVKHYGDHYYNWSENISDAWQLFEEMNGWAIQKFDTGHYVARFNSIFQVTPPAADTVPMAICLAWLKWKESK